MLRYFDDGLDELGATAHQAAPLRVGVTVGMSFLATLMLPAPQVVGWAAVVLSSELWAWLATIPQSRGERGSMARRLSYAGSLWMVVNCWMAMGAMLWAGGGAEGVAGAVVVWLSVIFFAQTHAYQSVAGLVIGGLWPLLVLPPFLIWGPNPLHMRLATTLGVMVLAFLFAGDGVMRMLRARREFDETQADLSQKEAQYRVLADNITDVIALNEIGGKRVYISPSVEGTMGFTPAELFSTDNYAFLHPDDADWVRRALSRLTQEEGELTLQYRVLHKDGAPIWVETNFGLVAAEQPGDPPLVISVSRQIEARKALEVELVEARRRAEAAAAAKSDFLANMTHELRTPLNAIIGFSGVLKGSSRLGPEDARHVGLIHDASETLLELVNSVLDYSKLDAGAVELEARAFDPVAPARAIRDLLEPQAAARGLSMAVAAEGEITPLVGDAARLRQVLLNFLSNALKFTTSGGVTVTVRQEPAGPDAGKLRVEVADTGLGVAPEQIEHLFDRFTQADASVSRTHGGTGLGLAICKRTIELMGGSIGAHSRPGEGSTFWFELVLPRAESLDDGPAAATAEAPERALRVLLVEDVAVNRELILTLLRPFDIEIETAENGLEAVNAMGERAYDLVLMDVQMPVMDGLTATRAIRALPFPAAQATPIVAMTANVLPEQVEKCLAAGMDDHLRKPISPQALLAALSRWSEGREAGAAERLSA